MNKIIQKVEIGSLLLSLIFCDYKLAYMAQTNRRTLTPTTKELTQQQLNEQSVMAIEWVQQSGEYAALAHQAFNLAKIAFEHAVAKKVKNPAVIVDIDETVLDNSAYQAGLIDTNHLFSPSSWHQWVLTEKARAIPGAVAFVNYVHAQGGKVFFISNRAEKSSQDSQDNELELATINNLQAVGLTGVNDSSVLLKGEFSRVIDGVENTSKQFRREAVENGNADGKFYTIVALVGDNLNDFDGRAGITNRQRRAHVAT